MDSRTQNASLRNILSEDLGAGDVTMAFTPERRIRAQVVSKGRGFISGLLEARHLFRLYGVQAKTKLRDGDRIKKGSIAISLEGSSRKIFSLSRSALNILSRMSGVTTLTRNYVQKVEKTHPHARIMATRKTTPLFRYFEKKAVKVGGGLTHRMGLYDMILIKHDHLAMFPGGIPEALRAAKKSRIGGKVEIEVENVSDAVLAAKSKADVIMLDNMPPKEIKKVIYLLNSYGLRGKVKIEVSGGINIKNISGYAKCGVDFISVGGLTHSPPSIDFHLRVVD